MAALKSNVNGVINFIIPLVLKGIFRKKNRLAFLLSYSVQGLHIKIPTFDIKLKKLFQVNLHEEAEHVPLGCWMSD